MTKLRTAIEGENHIDRMQRMKKVITLMKKEIIELTEEIHEIEHCPHKEWISCNPKGVGRVNQTGFSVMIECEDCGSYGLVEWNASEGYSEISWDKTHL